MNKKLTCFSVALGIKVSLEYAETNQDQDDSKDWEQS